MSAYRYLCFPPGAQPSATDLVRFRSYHDQLDNHVAYGVRREDAALVIVCELESFDRLCGLDPQFDEIIQTWQSHGVELTDTLGFVKEAKPWKRILDAESSAKQTKRATQDATTSAINKKEQVSPHFRFSAWMIGERLVRKKQDLADESYGRGLLELHRSAEQARRYERIATALPYFLWGLAAFLIISLGFYVSNRLLDGKKESRAETIQRINEDAMHESLKRK